MRSFLFLSLLLFHAFSLAQECNDLFRSKAQEVQSNWASEHYLNDLRRSSEQFKQRLKNKLSEEERTYDYLFVGAGIHTGIAKASLAKSLGEEFRDVKLLTIEATNTISVFGRLGKTFRGNTLEHPEIAAKEKFTREELIAQSRNFQAGSPIQVADVAHSPVPLAEQFQAPAVANHWLYGGDFLFESPVAKISKKGEKLYAIETKNGEKVFARNIVLGTGLGKSKWPTKDSRSLEFLAAQEGTPQQKVFFVEDLLSQFNKLANSKENFLSPFAGKKVIIVGGGHGGAIGIEAVEGLGPSELYEKMGGFEKKLAPASYLWVNLKASTGEEFKKVIGGGERYHHLAPLIDEGKIKTNQFYVHEILPDGEGIKVTFLDKKTGLPVEGHEKADFLIYATGYESLNPGLLSSLGKPEELQFQPVLEEITPNDKRLFTGGPVTVATQLESENIFVIGPSAGQIIHPQDPGGVTSVTMNVFGPRSEAFGKFLAKKRKE